MKTNIFKYNIIKCPNHSDCFYLFYSYLRKSWINTLINIIFAISNTLNIEIEINKMYILITIIQSLKYTKFKIALKSL